MTENLILLNVRENFNDMCINMDQESNNGAATQNVMNQRKGLCYKIRGKSKMDNSNVQSKNGFHGFENMVENNKDEIVGEFQNNENPAVEIGEELRNSLDLMSDRKLKNMVSKDGVLVHNVLVASSCNTL